MRISGLPALADGIAGKSGYQFQLWLPTGGAAAVPEPGIVGGGDAILLDANSQEVRFACYAWPASIGNSGNRAFAVSQQAEVFATPNKDAQGYDGLIPADLPLPDAAFVENVAAGEVAMNLEGQFITGDTGTGDGIAWLPAGN